MESSNCPREASKYIWKAGDTLTAIALRFGVPEQSVRQANPGLDFDGVKPGESICVPQRMLACVDGVMHLVRAGDTIESIASAHGVTALGVMERNPYVDPTELVPGMLLCVPDRAPEAAPSSSAPSEGPQPAASAKTPDSPGQIAQAQCPSGYTFGMVGYGDGYGDILLRYNVSYQAFRLSNPNLNPDRLLPGQRFCIPPTGSRGLCSAGGLSYIMEAGDSLQGVAQRFDTTPAALLRANANLAPSDFVPGRVICIGTANA